MLETTAALGQAILSGVWSLFGVYVPGFDFTFGQMWLAVALASISILVIKFIFGFSGGSRSFGPRTGSTSPTRVSVGRVEGLG